LADGAGYDRRTQVQRKESSIHWSQPEIVLYDTDPKNCLFDPKTRMPGPGLGMSYPDLIEQDGRYWITETQKTVARVHSVDPELLEGLWKQGTVIQEQENERSRRQ